MSQILRKLIVVFWRKLKSINDAVIIRMTKIARFGWKWRRKQNFLLLLYNANVFTHSFSSTLVQFLKCQIFLYAEPDFNLKVSSKVTWLCLKSLRNSGWHLESLAVLDHRQIFSVTWTESPNLYVELEFFRTNSRNFCFDFGRLLRPWIFHFALPEFFSHSQVSAAEFKLRQITTESQMKSVPKLVSYFSL